MKYVAVLWTDTFVYSIYICVYVQVVVW